jgi:hypothetical protein
METVKQVLMLRDDMLEADADDLINDFKAELELLISDCAIDQAEDLLHEYFGLEPDYLMEFLG